MSISFCEPPRRLQSVALPPRGEVLIRCAHFSDILIPARWCSREAKGNAVREGRIVKGKL